MHALLPKSGVVQRPSLRDDEYSTASAGAQSVTQDSRSLCSTRNNVQLRSLGLPLATVLLGSLLGGSGSMVAQTFPAAGVSAPASRVLGDWRGSAGVAIPRSKPSRNPAAIDLGPAPANQVLGRMLLLLAPSPAQQQALAAELAQPAESFLAQLSPLAHAAGVCSVLCKQSVRRCCRCSLAREPGIRSGAVARRARLD